MAHSGSNQEDKVTPVASRQPGSWQVYETTTWGELLERAEEEGLGGWLSSALNRLHSLPTPPPLGRSAGVAAWSELAVGLSPGEGVRFWPSSNGGNASSLPFAGDFHVTVRNDSNIPNEAIKATCIYRIRSLPSPLDDAVGIWTAVGTFDSKIRFPAAGLESVILIECDRSSAVWAGVPSINEELDICLGSGCTISGDIQPMGGRGGNGGGVVSLWSGPGEADSILGSCEVDASGSWELPELISSHGSQLTVKHANESCVESIFEVGIAPGVKARHLSCLCSAAVGQVVAVFNVDDTPVSFCDVEALWLNESGVGWEIQRMRCDEFGMAEFTSIPALDVYFRVATSGYSATLVGPYQLPLEYGHPVTIYPSRPAAVEGVVMIDGSFASDFELLWWRSKGDVERRQFHGVSNGEFVLEDVPEGDWWFVAAQEGVAVSAPMLINLEASSRRQVKLAMASMPRISGVVIDSATGRPVAEATVAASYPGQEWVGAEGSRLETGPRGEFDALGVPVERGSVVVWKPGYIAVEHALSATDYALGALSLKIDPVRGCSVKLESASAVDFTKVGISCSGIESEGVVKFDAVGHVSIKAVSSNVVSGQLYPPWDGVMYYSFDPDSLSDRTARMSLDVGRVVTVHVEFSGSPPWVELRYINPNGIRLVAARRVSESTGSAAFTEVTGGALQIAVVDQGLDTYHSVEDIPSSGDWSIEVAGDLGTMAIPIIGAGGLPVADQVIWVYFGGKSPVHRSYRTDSGGVVVVPRALARDALMVIADRQKALLWWSEVAPLVEMAGSQPNMVIARYSRVACRYRGQPVAGASVEYSNLGLQMPLLQYDTDVSGVAPSVAIGSPDYGVSVRHPSYWPVSWASVDGGKDGLSRVDLRKTLPLQIDWSALPRDSQGLFLEIQDLLSGEYVHDWIRNGYVQGTLSRRAEHEALVSDMPEGAYTWELIDGVNVVGSGRIVLDPEVQAILRPEIR